MQAAYKYVPKTWDPYSVLAPTCHATDPAAAATADAAVAQYTPFLAKLRQRYGIDTSYNPCISSWTPTCKRSHAHDSSCTGAHDWLHGRIPSLPSPLFNLLPRRSPCWRPGLASRDWQPPPPFPPAAPDRPSTARPPASCPPQRARTCSSLMLCIPCDSRCSPLLPPGRWLADMNRPDVIKAIHADKHKDPQRRWPDHPKNWN